MPGIDGLNVLAWVRDHQPEVEVVMLTGHGDVKDAVEAMKQGAWDFLIKDTPFDGTAVKAALAKLRTVRALRQEALPHAEADTPAMSSSRVRVRSGRR